MARRMCSARGDAEPLHADHMIDDVALEDRHIQVQHHAPQPGDAADHHPEPVGPGVGHETPEIAQPLVFRRRIQDFFCFRIHVSISAPCFLCHQSHLSFFSRKISVTGNGIVDCRLSIVDYRLWIVDRGDVRVTEGNPWLTSTFCSHRAASRAPSPPNPLSQRVEGELIPIRSTCTCISASKTYRV